VTTVFPPRTGLMALQRFLKVKFSEKNLRAQELAQGPVEVEQAGNDGVDELTVGLQLMMSAQTHAEIAKSAE
jgi:hypothetical protein